MAVRRLAEEQPPSFTFTPENLAWCHGQIAKYPKGRQASAVIPLLWKAQEQNGNWLPRKALEEVARMLGMPDIRVLEIATFYSMFNLSPVGRHFIQLCGTTPCQLRGALAIRDLLQQRIGDQGVISSEGFSWLEVECLGACCNAPMVQINQTYFEDLTVGNLTRLLDDLAAGRPVRPGSQAGRTCSEFAPGKATTLLDPALYDGSLVGAWRARFAELATSVPPTGPSVPASPPTLGSAAPQTKPPLTPPSISPAPPVAAPASAAREAPAAAAPVSAAEAADGAARLAGLPADASAEDKAHAVGTKPQALAAPKHAGADDLKQIRGIGRVNEGRLNALGIYHFDQIAAWTRPEIRWVATYLSFPGRIDREDWVGQARILASGAQTAFSRRVAKGEVPTSAGGAPDRDGKEG
jgi:NADH-quinone oxidoreductase subunit E